MHRIHRNKCTHVGFCMLLSMPSHLASEWQQDVFNAIFALYNSTSCAFSVKPPPSLECGEFKTFFKHVIIHYFPLQNYKFASHDAVTFNHFILGILHHCTVQTPGLFHSWVLRDDKGPETDWNILEPPFQMENPCSIHCTGWCIQI